jgi:lactam utilization protein B
MYFKQELVSPSGEISPLIAETYCLHGDAKNALQIVQFISSKLESLNISLDKNG